MPIYEYRCEACAYLFDELQKVSDPPLKECPECGALELRRLMSAPSFRLKGGGWYETDFKSDKERKRNLAGGRDADAGDKGDKGDKSEKGDKSQTGEKGDKGEKSDKSSDKQAKDGKDHKQDKSEARNKPASGKSTDAVA